MADEKQQPPTFFRTEKRSPDPAVAAQVEQGKASAVYETPDYRVIVGRLSSGPEGTAQELLVRYIVQHKRHGVIYGSASGLGQAVAAAIQAQIEFQNAEAASKEFEARNFKMMTEEAPPKGPLIPDFSGGMN